MKRAFVIVYAILCTTPAPSQSYIAEINNEQIKVKPVVPIQAYAFNLKDVRLLAGPFRHAMELDSAYLLLLKPDRLLYRFYKNADLPVKDSIYGGWETEGLSGHTLGHYLSALSMLYASTGDPQFRQRTDYITAELKRCQAARKTGYVGAIPNEDSIFGKVAKGEIRSSGFDLNGGWSPWYTVHKLMAGLVDVYLYCQNQQALDVVTGMADWTYNTVNHLTDSIRLKMLNCEYGGMNDVLVNIYSITGNEKYLRLSRKFHDEFVLGKLAQRIDPLPGKHSNTNVPKAIGCASRYELTGSKEDKTIAVFFWETMVHNHTYVIGGNSNYEYCGEQKKLNDRLSDNTCETCNTYNMLKLTRHLFSLDPSSALMDYYERALYNHILASQNPESGMMCYFVPLRMGTKKAFSDSFNTFTCCVGSGMENHSKYAEQIYSHDGKNTLFVNLFIPSVLNWGSKNIILIQETGFPESNAVGLSIKTSIPVEAAIKIRQPSWTKRAAVKINGKALKIKAGPDGYFTLQRTWKNKDRITIDFPMDLYTESMPDNPNRIAIKYGPVVMAGLLGKSMPDPVYGTPVLLTNNKDVRTWLRPVKDSALTFKTADIGKPFDVTLVPFYKVYDQYYSVYWDYFTPQNWAARVNEYEAEKKRQQEIAVKTIDYFRIGEMQPERDHKLVASERSYTSDALGIMGREARSNNFFAFEMKIDPSTANGLLLTYIGDDKDRKFDILVENVKIATEEWNGGQTGRFYDKEYSIPPDLVKNKNTVTVRIEANYGKTAGRVFGARTIR